jgi:hypothetical protein
MSSPLEHVLAALRSRGRSLRRSGEGYSARCPAHNDRNPSLSVGEAEDGRVLLNCHAGCTETQVVAALGLKMSDLFPPTNGNGHKAGLTLEDLAAAKRLTLAFLRGLGWKNNGNGILIPYRLPNGSPAPRSKKRWGRKATDGSCWWPKEGPEPIAYGVDRLGEARDAGYLIFVEGETDTVTLWYHGLPGLGLPGADMACKIEPEYLKGIPRVYVVREPDRGGDTLIPAVAARLRAIGWTGEAFEVRLPDGIKDTNELHIADPGGFKSAFQAALDSAAALNVEPRSPAIIHHEQPRRTLTLPAAMAVFARWMRMPKRPDGTPDMGAVEFVLGTVAANLMPGDPVWGLLVGAPSSGKTEILNAIVGLPNVHPTATLTEPSLLSGTPKREKAKDAKGGLLRVIGDSGIILCKDFGSVINQQKDTQATTLAALREIYDGSWTRHVGTDGGRTLHWSGKVGLVGGCTPAIDRRHAVMATMGERFIFYRLVVEDDAALARAALEHIGCEAKMRAELAAAVAGLFAGLNFTREPRPLSEDERKALINLACYIVRCRSAAERSGYTQEIELIPDPEAPGRLTLVLARLLAGLDLIGLDRAEAWRVVQRVGLDSMPALRRKVIDVLAARGTMTTANVALSAAYPTQTARRQLEELACYGVVDRAKQGNADTWTLSSWARERHAGLTVPEIPKGVRSTEILSLTPSRITNGKSGKVPPATRREL